MIMHNMETVAIWFTLVTTGMILTLLMPWIVSESRSRAVTQVEREPIPAERGFHEQAGTIGPIVTEV